ncbi:MAG: hypothetical protein G01um101418_317 [Parcubacteria group bacterium Gr01-1014_18]|nr:MAG: hypothetical protein Greene041636_307 [Parcubacteria group bacterium Greene0416_36]TSC81177.1 MAG: hypothetical protein G01um101418_317 [Parcubacteria group bacterium Gr01-1014_18]TSC99174.1 MAG: hypothetical protein Greene101420_319 [Parcubacteria group bacterium Greene1014_20]TSD07468.1 MAG: hypothetical protein Greene07142_167 [Parcubacteria group bacterium Greene0714_2]
MPSFFKKLFLSSMALVMLFGVNVGFVSASVSETIMKGDGFFSTTMEKASLSEKKDDATATGLAQRIGKLIEQALQFLGLVILIIIIYGGFLWLTAGGNTDKAAEARTLIFNAFMGALIIGTAYAITAFILLATQTTS